MARSLRFIGCLVVAAVLVAGCTSSGGTMPPAPSGPAHPHSASGAPGAENQASAASERCGFASMALVTKAFGAVGVTESVGRTPLGRATCRFAMRRSNVGAGGYVTLTHTPNTSARSFRGIQAAMAGARPLAGVADRAFYVPGTTTLHFQKTSVTVAITATLRVPGSRQTKPAVVRADLVTLARLVAAQM
jgi:hypothetical protein